MLAIKFREYANITCLFSRVRKYGSNKNKLDVIRTQNHFVSRILNSTNLPSTPATIKYVIRRKYAKQIQKAIGFSVQSVKSRYVFNNDKKNYFLLAFNRLKRCFVYWYLQLCCLTRGGAWWSDGAYMGWKSVINMCFSFFLRVAGNSHLN